MMETGILASLAICVTLCDLLNLSVPVFLHLWDDDYKTNLRVMSFMIKKYGNVHLRSGMWTVNEH